MPEQYTSVDKSVGELLSMTSPNIVVPEWQRSYSWTTSEIGSFWQDIMSFSKQYGGNAINEKHYFLGSIVLVNNGSYHELLDGQQRLATATILLSVLRDAVRGYREGAADRLAQKYIADYDDATGENSFKLTLNGYDRDFFRREIQEARVAGYAPPEPKLGSHRLIRSARVFFEKVAKEQYDACKTERDAFNWTLRVKQVLTDHVSVVAVVSTDEDNAASVFETLNDRGIGLSTPDLLRNLLLRRANAADIEEIIDCWRTVLELDKSPEIARFLRHFWVSREGDLKTRALYREIKNKIVAENVDPLQFSRNLQHEADIYGDLLEARDEDPVLRHELEGIRILGAHVLLPAVMSAYAAGDSEQKKRFLRALVVLFVRYSVIAGLENSRLETTVYNTASQLRKSGDFDAAIDELAKLLPTDDDFVAQFKKTQIHRQATARYVLRELEHHNRGTEELVVSGTTKVHVEHIYPKKPQAGQRWDNHDEAVNRIGNLTLLARRLNTSIRNGTFDVKKAAYEQSDILITKELAESEAWDMSAIENRQVDMSSDALGIWTFPDR